MVSVTLAKVQRNINDSGVSTSTFAALAKIPLSSMSAAFRGSHYIGAEKEVALYNLSIRVLEITDSLRPFLLKIGDLETLKILVDGDKSADTIRNAVNQIFS